MVHCYWNIPFTCTTSLQQVKSHQELWENFVSPAYYLRSLSVLAGIFPLPLDHDSAVYTKNLTDKTECSC